MIGDAMDRFVQLRGEEALARLMLKSERLKTPVQKKQFVGIPNNRAKTTTKHVQERMDQIIARFEGRIFCRRDVIDQFECTRGSCEFIINKMLKTEQIYRVPRLGGELGHRYRIA